MTGAVVGALAALGAVILAWFAGRRSRPSSTPIRPPDSIEADRRVERARVADELADKLADVAAEKDARMADIDARTAETKGRATLDEIRADLTGAVGRHKDGS